MLQSVVKRRLDHIKQVAGQPHNTCRRIWVVKLRCLEKNEEILPYSKEMLTVKIKETSLEIFSYYSPFLTCKYVILYIGLILPQDFQRQWFQHINRMNLQRFPKKYLEYRAKCRRALGRLKTRWKDRFGD